MSRVSNLEVKIHHNKIAVLDDFLDQRDCETCLRALHECMWQPSGVVKSDSAASDQDAVYSTSRSSFTVFEEIFPASMKRVLIKIEKILAREFKIDARKLETWQAINYDVGERFDFHIDGGSFKGEPAGDRSKSILIYLSSPEEGGSTFFRAHNFEVKPIPGRIVIWNNLLPSGLPDYGMIHAGMPVIKGSKTILITWEREKFYKNNKRLIYGQTTRKPHS